MENVLLYAEKLFANRYIISIKKAFTITLPLIMIGSIASLINNIPVAFVQDFLSSPVGGVVRSINGAIWLGTSAVLAILILWCISYYLSLEYGLNGMLGGLAAVSSYFAICITTADGGIALDRLGAGGLFGAMLIAILAVELYRALSGLRIRLGEETSEEVSQMFGALIPVALTVLIIASLNVLISLSGKGINEWLYTFLAFIFSPAESGGIPGALFLVFGIHIFWFFGIHGGNVLDGVMKNAYGDVLAANIEQFAATGDAYAGQLGIVSKGFLDVFVFMGGAGTSLCIIIAILLVGRSRYLRSIGKMGGVFAVFNMNEIMLFGIPVILNPLMLVPFLLTPLAITTVSWLAMNIGLVARTVADVHWAMPPLISGYLATGGHLSGALLQLFNIALGVVIYLPFIKRMDRRAAVREAQDNDAARLESTLVAVMEKITSSTGALNTDITGFARELEGVSGELGGVTGTLGEQMKMLQECTRYIENISGSVNDTNRSVQEVLENAENTARLSKDGVGNMESTTVRMQEILEATKSMDTLSGQLNQRCEQIKGILKSIESIAMHTTILSLNASVEAARAGAAGKGFQVVAADIKNLAGTTAHAVSDITELLQGMVKDTADMAGQCENSLQKVEKGQSQIADTNRLFEDILGSLQDVQQHCSTVLEFSGQVTRELEQVKGQLYTTNEFFGKTAEQTTEVGGKLREKSRDAAGMAARLRALDEETGALAADVLRDSSDAERQDSKRG